MVGLNESLDASSDSVLVTSLVRLLLIEFAPPRQLDRSATTTKDSHIRGEEYS
jgi:hypothetical protein